MRESKLSDRAHEPVVIQVENIDDNSSGGEEDIVQFKISEGQIF
jgi:hypothetical protein